MLGFSSMAMETQPLPGPIEVPQGPDPLLGQRVGDYVIEAPLAIGGMGIVYQAIHPLIGRKVAVKVLRPDLMHDQEQSARFLREAQALSTIKHQGIIDIITFGTLGDGRQFMVTEFLEGEPLDRLLQREGRLGSEQALGFVDDILAALSAAHRMGVVHRDLKPSNVFVSVQSNGERHVKLLDFGLAKQQPVAFAGQDASLDGARASLMIGTPEYLAPEQACGLQATPQTDLYCLGVMLFEMLAGRLPFLGGTVVELMRQHVMDKPPRLGALVPVSPRIDGLLETMLQKKPELRPASADATRELVRQAMLDATTGPRVTAVEWPVVGAPAVTEPESLPLAPVVRSRSRWPYAVPVVAAAGVALVFALGPGSGKPAAAPPAPPPVVDLTPPAAPVAAPPAATPAPVAEAAPTPAAPPSTDGEVLAPLKAPPKAASRATPSLRPAPGAQAGADSAAAADEAWRTETNDKLGQLEMAIKIDLAQRTDSEEALGRVKRAVSSLSELILAARTPAERAHVEKRMNELRRQELLR